MSETQVTQRKEQAAEKIQPPEMDTIYVPNVDIYEDVEGVRMRAEMPGVDDRSVDVTIENNVLTIEGKAQVDGPAGYELIGQEYGVGRYRRDFTLSDAVDTEGIKARVRHGVLEVTLPIRQVVKTRKIEITA